MVKNDNPAGKLYHILQAARSKHQDTITKIVWAEVFELDINSPTEIFYSLIELITLFKETKEALEEIEGINLELYLEPFPKIQRVITATNLDINWKNYQSFLTDAVMVNLAFCAEELSKKAGEIPIKDEEIKKLSSEVEALIESVLSSSLEQELKTILLDQLTTIRQAILSYRLFGISKLKDALEKNIGSIVINRELFKNSSKSKEISRFTKIVAMLERLVSVATKTKQLAEPVIKGILSIAEKTL